jgi:hypothetical protein
VLFAILGVLCVKPLEPKELKSTQRTPRTAESAENPDALHFKLEPARSKSQIANQKSKIPTALVLATQAY